jgi:hypothetical protein
MSNDEDTPMTTVILFLIILFIGLAYINYLCEPEKNEREDKTIHCKEKTK